MISDDEKFSTPPKQPLRIKVGQKYLLEDGSIFMILSDKLQGKYKYIRSGIGNLFR